MAQCLLRGQGVNRIAEHQAVGGGGAVPEVFQQHRLLHRRKRIDAFHGLYPGGKTFFYGLVLFVRPALSAEVRGGGLCLCDLRRVLGYCLQAVDERIGKFLCLAVRPYGRVIAKTCVERIALHDAVDV